MEVATTSSSCVSWIPKERQRAAPTGLVSFVLVLTDTQQLHVPCFPMILPHLLSVLLQSWHPLTSVTLCPSFTSPLLSYNYFPRGNFRRVSSALLIIRSALSSIFFVYPTWVWQKTQLVPVSFWGRLDRKVASWLPSPSFLLIPGPVGVEVISVHWGSYWYISCSVAHSHCDNISGNSLK